MFAKVVVIGFAYLRLGTLVVISKTSERPPGEVDRFTNNTLQEMRKMRKVRNTIAAVTMSAVLLFGATFANAGIIIAGLADQPKTDPCTDTTATKTDDKSTDLGGIIIAGLSGIIVADFTGIIVTDLKTNSEPVNCGIIIAG